MTSLSTYDFSTLHSSLPHNLIKYKLIEKALLTLNREGSFNLAPNDHDDRNSFFTSEKT